MSKVVFYLMLLGILVVFAVLAWFVFMLVYAKMNGFTLKQLWQMFDQVDNEDLKGYNDNNKD